MGKIAEIDQILPQFSNNVWRTFFSDIKVENIDDIACARK